MFWSEWITEVLRGTPFERTALSSLSASLEHRTRETITAEERTSVCDFLATYFGSPPRHPVFCLPESDLFLTSSDHLLFLRDPTTRGILGTLRYRWMGTVGMEGKGKDVSVVDCFCVAPAWRGKGIGELLLTELHRLATTVWRRPYALFLKEGSAERIPLFAAYTGSYVYRALPNPSAPSNSLRVLPVPLAHRLLRIHHQVYPERFLLFPGHTRNQWWFLYQSSAPKERASILIGVQDSYQKKDESRMAWVTAWLSTSCTTSSENADAWSALVHSPVLTSRFGWIWADRQMIRDAPIDDRESPWKSDGMFQWYTYQWNTPATFIHGYSMCA